MLGIKINNEDIFLASWAVFITTKKTLDVVGDIGSFSNDDGDGTENVNKAIGLLRKTTILLVHHAYCTFFPITARLQRELKCLISRFMEDANKRRRMFLFLSKLKYGSQEINFR